MKRMMALVMSVLGLGGCTVDATTISEGVGTLTTVLNLLKQFGILSVVAIMFSVCGCAENQSETRMTLNTLRDIAETGNVQGKLKVHLTSMGEAGMKEGVYFGTEGSVVDGELEYRFSEKPTSQPVE